MYRRVPTAGPPARLHQHGRGEHDPVSLLCDAVPLRSSIDTAKQALEKPGIWAKVEPKLAQADNIRNALTLVSRGEAKFGIVYATDAKADPKVKVASGAKSKPAEEFSTLNQRPYARPGAVVLFRSDRKDSTYPQTIRSRFCSVLDLVRSPGPDEDRDL